MTRVQTPQASSQDKGANPGWVSFVGSGPGDPGLLTVRAVELLGSAEVIVTEAPEHVDLVRSVLGLVEGPDGTWDGPEVVEGEDGEELWLRAVVLSEDGGLSVRMSTTGPVADAARIGTRLASDMLDEGAADLMEAPPVRNQHA